MTFSVLQSVYKKDNPDFLYQSLESIAGNTLLPQKIILVKDGELTPSLEKVISFWQKKIPLEVVGYETNRGLAFALNYGLQFVETELVARLDSVDICFPNRFEKQVIQFEIDSSLEILGGGIEEFFEDSSGVQFKKNRLYPKRTKKNSFSLYKGTPLAHPTAMIKTELLKKIGYAEKMKFSQDIDLWFRLLESGAEIRTLQEPVLHFRISEGTFSRRSVKKALNEFSIYKKNLRKFNGIRVQEIFLLLRLAGRFLPKKLNKKIYLSRSRQKFFKEKTMEIKILKNRVFAKGGHIFEAVAQFEENGTQMIKAVQLDGKSGVAVEIPLDEITLCKMHDESEIIFSN
jgi:glycosyltransferase involved in cell wall biosynthesis